MSKPKQKSKSKATPKVDPDLSGLSLEEIQAVDHTEPMTGDFVLDLCHLAAHLKIEGSDTIFVENYGKGASSIIAAIPMLDDDTGDIIRVPMRIDFEVDHFVGLKEAAAYARRNVRTIQRWIAEEGLESVTGLFEPGKVCIQFRDLEEFIERQGKAR